MVLYSKIEILLFTKHLLGPRHHSKHTDGFWTWQWMRETTSCNHELAVCLGDGIRDIYFLYFTTFSIFHVLHNEHYYFYNRPETKD